MKIRQIILIILLITAPVVIYSQELKTLTLEEALRIGIENSEVLNSSKARVISSEARIGEVNAERLPSLNFNAGYSRLSEIDPFSIQTPFGNFDISQSIPNSYNLQLSLRQPIFTGFRLSSNSKIAEYNYDAAKEEFSGDKQQLILDIKTAYWSLFRTNKIKEVVDENIDQINVHLKDVNNMFEEGLSTKNDLLKVEVQLAEAKLRQIDAANDVKLSMINLNNIVGFPLTTNIRIEESIDPQTDVIKDFDELIETAYAKRPELKAMEYRVKASETGIDAAQSSWYPQIYLAGNYNYARPNQRVFPVEDEFKDTWDVSVSLSFDIWNWNKTGNQTTQAEMQYEQAKDTYKILKDAVALELNSNYLNVLHAKEKISVSEFSVSQAEENYRVTNDLFKQGLILNSELIDAETALLQAKTNYVQALVDYKLAKANLERSIGELE